MDGYIGGRFTGAASGRELEILPEYNWSVLGLSGAGVFFILLGLTALALPTAHEGVHLWQLDSGHAFYLMDVAGSFALGFGIVLTWLGGQLWKRHVRP